VIDMLVDQSPEGLDVLRGSSAYTFDGNWKVQAENTADGHHVPSRTGTTPPQPAAAAPASRRTTRRPSIRAVGASRVAAPGRSRTATCGLWTWADNPQHRPLRDKLDELKRFGDAKGEFMVKGSRHLCLYPNVYVMDQFSTYPMQTIRSR